MRVQESPAYEGLEKLFEFGLKLESSQFSFRLIGDILMEVAMLRLVLIRELRSTCSRKGSESVSARLPTRMLCFHAKSWGKQCPWLSMSARLATRMLGFCVSVRLAVCFTSNANWRKLWP